MSRFARRLLLDIRVAYPGILGIPRIEVVTFEAIDVTYLGELVTWGDTGEDVTPDVDPNDGAP
jgi:hypothetical protein